ncbi:MAG: RluA family pseudouridine synthase [Alphaproteobacteria bacterium]|nr:RluA family pseudouridine synthase [Alphaproteobacteria bacterium]
MTGKGKAITIAVAEGAAGQRLDAVLADAIDGMSRSRLKSLILDGHLSLDGVALRQPSRKVVAGERFTLIVPDATPAIPQGQDIPLNILHEDEDLIIIDKPAGLVVHPAPGNPDRTLVNALIAHCGPSLTGIGGVRRPGIVHRLDKDTSGVMVAAKSAAAHASLSAQFAERTVDRAYRAIVFGSPNPRAGEIESLIGRSPRNRKKMAVVTRNGKAALTHYQTEQLLGPAEAPVASVLTCKLSTGRTHQIRVHLTHLGHPLIGDPVYGRAQNRSQNRPRGKRGIAVSPDARAVMAAFPRQALHAFRLGLEHPTSGKRLFFETLLPRDMVTLIDNLESLQ